MFRFLLLSTLLYIVISSPLPFNTITNISLLSSDSKAILSLYSSSIKPNIVYEKQEYPTVKTGESDSFKFTINNVNSGFGYDVPNVIEINKDGEKLNINEAIFNVNYSNRVHSINRPHLFNEFNLTYNDVSYKANCVYNCENIISNSMLKKVGNDYISRIVLSKQFSFALKNGEVWEMEHFGVNDKNLKDHIHFNEEHLDRKQILYKDIFTTFDEKNRKYYLILLSDNDLSVFEMIYNKINNTQTIETLPNITFISATSEFDGNNHIYDIVMYNNILYIGVEREGLYQLELDVVNKVINYKDKITYFDNVNNDHISLSIIRSNNNNTKLYSVIKNKGLAIYVISPNNNLSYIDTILHPKMLKLFSYINPFNGQNYLSVQIEHMSTIGGSLIYEFLIEFEITNDIYVNQIFSKNDGIISDISTSNDLFFFYCYDKTNNFFYLIRKGVSRNSGDLLIYSLKVIDSEIMDDETILVRYRQLNEMKFFPGLYNYKKKRLFTYNKLELKNNTIACTLKDAGVYTLILQRKVNSCESSLSTLALNGEIVVCNKIELYQIKAVGDEFNAIALGFIIAFSICLIMSIVLIIIFVKKSYGDIKKNIKLVKINKDNKTALYAEDNSFCGLLYETPNKDEFKNILDKNMFIYDSHRGLKSVVTTTNENLTQPETQSNIIKIKGKIE